MQPPQRRFLLLFMSVGVCFNLVFSQRATPTLSKQKKPASVISAAIKAAPAAPSVDLSKQPTLYVVGYAHLDTEWRWQYPQTIDEYLSKTLRNNFYLTDKYPHYIFNFSGANRYRLMKEYYPADFEKLRQYVKEGRWFPAGSSME